MQQSTDATLTGPDPTAMTDLDRQMMATELQLRRGTMNHQESLREASSPTQATSSTQVASPTTRPSRAVAPGNVIIEADSMAAYYRMLRLRAEQNMAEPAGEFVIQMTIWENPDFYTVYVSCRATPNPLSPRSD